MIPELGHFALILALLLSVLLATLPLVGVVTKTAWLSASGRSLAVGQFVFILFSFVCLGHAFVNDDFTVQYVANHSNSLLPIQYKISAIWGGHEGSLLLWSLTLAGWTIAVAVFSQQLPREMLARVLAIMGMISIGFLLFILITSNPFSRYLPDSPTEGADLNPLLQDFGLIVHPPMLYMGYVGFSVAFAFAIAALMSGRFDSAWARWSRPWTITAWAFLTVGIALGSWWAYYELGWGGWWFWDPVENASFMPWLVGTALMHSLAVTEKRGAFKSWTLLLAIVAFSLSLLGTFLVRSGVLTSVHAFASDPARGQFVLVLLAISIIASLTLFALRAPALKSTAKHSLLSRESFLLVNNVILVVSWVTVMLGTLYPLILDFAGAGKMSIGPPYFNAVFSPLMGILAIMLGFGVTSYWKKTPGRVFVEKLRWVAISAVIIAFAFAALRGQAFSIIVFIGVFLGCWVVGAGLVDLAGKLRNKRSLLTGLRALPLSYFGMQLGHIGFAFMIVGAVVVSLDSEEMDVRMAPGDRIQLGDYTFAMSKIDKVQGPNYRADQAHIVISKDGLLVSEQFPEKRIYVSQSSPMTEAGIDAGFFRDLFVAMGEPLENGAWAMRIQYKPLIRWVWLGAIFMGLGGLCSVVDKRYRPVLAGIRKDTRQSDINAVEVKVS